MKLNEILEFLSLKTMAANYEEEAKKALKRKDSYTDYLKKLAEEERLKKLERSVNARIAKAKFPFIKTFEMFDYDFQASLDELYIKELSNLSFLEKAENILMVGPPGVGKTHLACAFGVKACQERKRVLFCQADQLLEDLTVAASTNTLPDKMAFLSRLDLLIVDELGYMPVEGDGANLLFQLVSRRYETGSIILTSNKPFAQWGEIFGDETIASAILDRLVHHSHIFQITGKSYRIKDKMGEKT